MDGGVKTATVLLRAAHCMLVGRIYRYKCTTTRP